VVSANSFHPTHQQLEVADRFRLGDALRVNAYAGTGKTSTLEFLSKQTRKRGLYLAFNRVIAKEAVGRFGANTACMTIHALAQRNLPAEMRQKLAKDFVVPAQLLEDHLVRRCGIRRSEAAPYRRAVSQCLQAYFRSADARPSVEAAPYGFQFDFQNLEPDTLNRALVSCWASMARFDGELPLSHGAYLKWFFLYGCIEGYDYIVVDEAQDLGPITVSIIRKAELQTVWVGDRYQAIYDWNGAENALDTIEGADEVFLTKSFRIGEERAELVSALLADLDEFKPIVGNPDVKTIVGTGHQPVRIVRNNMTLLAKLLHLSKRKKVFALSGAGRLKKLVRDADLLMRGKRPRGGQLSKFSNWEQVQDQAARRFGHPYTGFVRAIEEVGCQSALEKLDDLADSAHNADITLSTVHGAKGCEFDAVSIYDDFRGQKQKGQFYECMPAPVTRLLYVAVTRAKETLYIEKPLANRFGLARFEHQDATIAADPEIVVPPVSAEPDNDVIEPVWASHVKHVHETYPAWSDPIKTHVEDSEDPQRVARKSAYDRYGGFAIGIALGLFVAIALDFIGLISL